MNACSLEMHPFRAHRSHPSGQRLPGRLVTAIKVVAEAQRLLWMSMIGRSPGLMSDQGHRHALDSFPSPFCPGIAPTTLLASAAVSAPGLFPPPPPPLLQAHALATNWTPASATESSTRGCWSWPSSLPPGRASQPPLVWPDFHCCKVDPQTPQTHHLPPPTSMLVKSALFF